MYFERWLWSFNAKDIGSSYLIFSLFFGLIGMALSVLIRIELSAPEIQYIGDNQLYNSIITAHAIVMIFFVVMLAMIVGYGKVKTMYKFNTLARPVDKYLGSKVFYKDNYLGDPLCQFNVLTFVKIIILKYGFYS